MKLRGANLPKVTKLKLGLVLSDPQARAGALLALAALAFLLFGSSTSLVSAPFLHFPLCSPTLLLVRVVGRPVHHNDSVRPWGSILVLPR